jgi:hypothetical protein
VLYGNRLFALSAMLFVSGLCIISADSGSRSADDSAMERPAPRAIVAPSPPFTIVTPHFEAPIESGRNTIFCSPFQLAWNRMKNEIIGEDIRLEKPLELVRYLNGSLVAETDIAGDDYLAMAGYGSKDIADAINMALKEKFGENASRIEDVFNDEDVVLAYAFLLKEMQFENPFEDFEHPLDFNWKDESANVEAFGFFDFDDSLHGPLRDQVEIIDYRDRRDFIVRLNAADAGDEIIIARVKPEKTLLGTYETVNARIARIEPEPIGERDLLMVPKIDLSIEHSYAELLGLHLRNEGWEDYFIAAAEQDIRFRLDESGASVKSQGIFAIKKGPPADFHVLSFCSPFLIYCRKKGAEFPYLAIWVGNAELLVSSR